MNRIFKYVIIFMLMVGLFLVTFACSNITEPESFTVEYNVTVGGDIDGEKNQTIKKGEDGSFITAVADDGYFFVKWSDEKTNPTRQETNVQGDISVTAQFAQEIDDTEKLAVSYTASEGGYISGGVEQLIPYGGNATQVTALPYTGYDFIGWSDGIETATRHDKEIQQEINVTAEFQKKSFEVNYYAGKGGKIDGNENQTVTYGNSATKVTAVPDTGYKFVRWSDTKSPNSVRTDTNVTKSINATAEFAYVLTDGRGTPENPFLIETYEQFLDIKLYSNLYYKLVNDLDLSGKNHEPLFNGLIMFNGVFEGAGHTISNMKVDTYSAYPSLFGYINLGTVQNLNIIDFEITVPNYNTSAGVLCIGAVAGESWGVLDNIYIQGVIKGNGLSYDGVAIGGLVGQAGNLLMNCRADVTIEINDVTRSGYTYYPFNIGGLVGVGFANIISCEVQGTISVSEAHSDVLIGGLIGYFMVDGTDIFLGNLTIKNCVTSVEIVNGNGSLAHSGGLIASAVIYWGVLKIENCAVYGDIINGNQIGGFIKNITSYGASEIRITNSHVKNDITMFDGAKGGAAGFIYWIINDSDSSGTFEIINCYTEGSIIAAMVAGFCYIVSSDINFYRCYAACNIQTQAASAGFIAQVTGGRIEECFSTGTIIVKYQCAGFISFSIDVYIKNCYSKSNIFVTNTDPDTEWRTFANGLIDYARDSNIINCYYSGKISGFVYTSSKVSGLGSIVGDFAGYIINTQIINCHLLYHDDTFATDIIVECSTPDEFIDLTIYNNIAEMSSLADILNEGLDEPIWINGENSLPQLKFVTN